ncbi:hypothetical protein [Streptomyces yanii]|uniref:Uncharacterized protein n=1 Tax=Streptomyces yanii TaxID=78510 RepID=A0ABV5R5F5_9ACTN
MLTGRRGAPHDAPCTPSHLFGALAFATVTVLYGLPLLLPVLPCPMAAAGRRAELRATALGFARMLAEVLHTVHLGESQDDPAAPPAALSVARTPTHARRRAATPYATG